MSIFNGLYFTENPDKILGKIVTHNPNTGRELTNQFGRPTPQVWGDISDVKSGINVPAVKRYDHFIERKKVKVPKKQTGKVDPVTEAIRKTNQQKKREPQAKQYSLQSLADTILDYNKNVEYTDYSTNRLGVKKTYSISKEEIKVWVTYQVSQGLFDKETIIGNAWGEYLVDNPSDNHWKQWSNEGLVYFDGQAWIPAPVFLSGNIYTKLKEIKSRSELIISKIGEEQYEDQLSKLESVKPIPLLITEDESRKLYLSPFHKIFNEIKISELSDGTTFDLDYSIGTIFYEKFLNDLPKEDFVFENKTTSAYEIYYYWIEKRNFPRNRYTKAEKAAIKRNTTILGQKLFDRFLLEMLTREDKVKIAAIWNAQYNSYKDIDYHKIPVGFTMSENFKGGKLAMRAAQREGVAFMNHRGTGIVAYDVGVGKTMTAIAAISDGMEKGLFKRPMIVVPQKVYKKWIEEISGVYAEKDIKKGKKIIHKKGDLISAGILPHLRINDYDNMGVLHLDKVLDENGVAYTVPEFSITMITFEGLEKIGFSEESEGDLTEHIKQMLSQGESGRSAAIVELQAERWVDEALAKTEVDIEELGIDCIIVDETHNFRVLFTEVKGDVKEDGEREKKNFMSGGSGKPSSRAIKLFMLNSYIQSKHNGRNTFGLTATPFTNRVTEIYTMLAHYDISGLKEFNVYNLAQFCTNYIDETLEDVWTVSGKFDIKAVIRGFNNLPALQALVFRAINYKTGEDANILRPEKVVLPLFNDEKGVPLPIEYIADTKIPPSIEQQAWFDKITDFINYTRDDNTGMYKSPIFNYYEINEKKNKVLGDVLIALNASRVATFSPYALSFGSDAYYDVSKITYQKFVDNSPKIKYIVECIRSVKQYHEANNSPVSGQIIYADRGTEWFYHIKDYLVNEIGFTDKQVAIFHGKVSKGRREKIKDGFQKGDIKVIIGSSTLREGVDLQNHCSAIYLAYIDWNPTDLHQLWGRGWRFGNKHTHIRIVVPLIENSSDIFTWQKLSEKMSRINSIWSRSDRTKMFEESELNPEELKKGLINDPKELARWEIEEELSGIKTNLSLDESNLKSLEETQMQKDKFFELGQDIEGLAKEAISSPTSLKWDITDKQRDGLLKMEIEKDDMRSVYRIVRRYADLKQSWYDRSNMRQKVEQHIKYKKRLKRVEDKILKPYKLTLFDDYTMVMDELRSKIQKAQATIERLKSPEHEQVLIEKIIEEQEAMEKNRKPLPERVNEFARMNYLLDCRQGQHTCDIMGRVVEQKSGKKIEIKKQPKVDFSYEEAKPYKLPAILKKLIPDQQRAYVNERVKDIDEEHEDFIQNLERLEQELSEIPKLYKQSKLGKDAIVHAHYFLGGTDYYITEWDGKDTLYGYAILNGDTQMAELGYVGREDIMKTTASKPYKKGFELDFNWTKKTLNEVLGISKPNEPVTKDDPGLEPVTKDEKLPKTDDKTLMEGAVVGMEAALAFADAEGKKSLNVAIEGIKTALLFA
jgi:superfamily II DNA or RNA helicase